MKKWQKILLTICFVATFIISMVVNIPAWMLGKLIYKYSQHKLTTINEHGTFWNGHAMLIAIDSKTKGEVPLLLIGWKIKPGLSKFIDIEFSSANQSIAHGFLTNSGVQVNNVNLALSLDQLTPLLTNLNSLSLSGDIRLNASKLLIAKKMTGDIEVNLDNVASGMSPVNPIGNYQVKVNLETFGIHVSSSSNSVISIDGEGNLNALTLKSRVQEDKKEQLLQFMTMLGVPQADGSYQFKVF